MTFGTRWVNVVQTSLVHWVATFVQRLANVFQTSMTFGTRWLVVVQTSLVDWVATFVQRLPNVFQTSMTFETRWVLVVQTSPVHWVGCIVSKVFYYNQKALKMVCRKFYSKLYLYIYNEIRCEGLCTLIKKLFPETDFALNFSACKYSCPAQKCQILLCQEEDVIVIYKAYGVATGSRNSVASQTIGNINR